MRRLLLCPPDYFGIEYEINPWMRRTQKAEPELARAQWKSLHDTLQSLGCQIDLLAPQPGLPDLVFTANAGLAVGRRFILSNFRHKERRGEEVHFERWFAELQRRRLDRGVFCSIDELTCALEQWIKFWNANAKPFRWTRTADQIIDAIGQYCERISGPGH